jgi:hypothetical protein
MIRRRYCFLFLLTLTCASTAQSQVKFVSSNLPIIVIDTHGQTIPDSPKITADMGIIFNGVGVINKLSDPTNNFSGTIGIELRGSSSQSFPKKPYGFETRDATGNSLDVSLLGLPKENDWILFAAYDDKSLMRDVLSYKLGRDQGRYASRYQFCELVLNGIYQGVYVLLEKIKRDANRVDIAKLTTTDISGDDLTGGYIIKIDKATGSGGSDGWTSAYPPLNRSNNQTVYFLYDYPKSADITAEQKNYIKNYVNSFEATLSDAFFQDPVKGYAKYIDVDSFVDFFIMMEVTKNPDGYRLSTFLFKDKDSKGGKLTMGPIWDFNEGFGNVDYCTKGNPEGFVLDYNKICPDDYWLIPFWWDRLLKDYNFSEKVINRWSALRSGPFKTSKVMSYIDSVSSVLSVDSARQRNFVQWPVLGQYVWPNYYVGQTYTDEVNWLKSWVSQRMAWLDNNLGSLVTAVEENPASFSVNVFPNPFAKEITIEYNLLKPGAVQFEVYNLIGQKLDSFSETQDAGGSYQKSYYPEGPAGTYILKSYQGDAVRFSKLIKK